jgi:soluble lytic murein transglycosylase-like protein
VDRLQFGTTARKRARRRRRIRRVSLLAWVVSTIALAGGPIYGLNQAKVLDLQIGEPEPAPSSSAASTEVAIDSVRKIAGEPKKHIMKKPRPEESGSDGSYSGSVTEIIQAAAAEHGVDGDYLVSIAVCESGLDPQAYNSAGYHGLFQYDDSTWAAYGNGDIWDPVAQAQTTAKLIADGQSSRWPNCG